jgi:hypothetical protein
MELGRMILCQNDSKGNRVLESALTNPFWKSMEMSRNSQTQPHFVFCIKTKTRTVALPQRRIISLTPSVRRGCSAPMG